MSEPTFFAAAYMRRKHGFTNVTAIPPRQTDRWSPGAGPEHVATLKAMNLRQLSAYCDWVLTRRSRGEFVEYNSPDAHRHREAMRSRSRDNYIIGTG